MTTRDDIYAAIRNADAAGDAESVRKLGAYLQTLPAATPMTAAPVPQEPRSLLSRLFMRDPGAAEPPTMFSDPSAQVSPEATRKQAIGAGGLAYGATADIGNSLLNMAFGAGEKIRNALTSPTVSDLVTGQRSPSALAKWNAERSASLNTIPQQFASPEDVAAFGAGRLAGNVAATAPVGGALGELAASANLPRLANALASGGLSLGAAAPALTAGGRVSQALTNTALRAAGGAGTGAASTALVNPDDALTGAGVGAAIPLGVRGLGAAGSFAARAAAPLFPSNDAALATNFLRDYLGPEFYDRALGLVRTRVNAGPQLLPGYQPTAAEIAGGEVPALAGMQRQLTGTGSANNEYFGNVRPNNNQALTNALEGLAGRGGEAEHALATRSATSQELYKRALDAGIDPRKLTPEVLANIDTLMNNEAPAVARARKYAEGTAKNEAAAGLRPAPAKNGIADLQGMQDFKSGLDVQIADAQRHGHGNEVRVLSGLKDNLMGIMQTLSPQFAEANATHAAMSVPINQFDMLGQIANKSIGTELAPKAMTPDAFLQALRSADAGVKGGLESLLSPPQMAQLEAVKRAAMGMKNITAGSAPGSATLQNAQILGMMPGPVQQSAGAVLHAIPGLNLLAGIAGRGVEGLYNSAGQRIREQLTNALINPEQLLAMDQAARLAAQRAAFHGYNALAAPAVRAAPVALSR